MTESPGGSPFQHAADLRRASDVFIQRLDRLYELETRKRELMPDQPEFIRLAREIDLVQYVKVEVPSVLPPGSKSLKIDNRGSTQHELLVFKSDLDPVAYPLDHGDINEDGPGITKISDGDNLDPGKSQTRTVDLTKAGKYLFLCNLPGHFAAHMYTVVTVT